MFATATGKERGASATLLAIFHVNLTHTETTINVDDDLVRARGSPLTIVEVSDVDGATIRQD